MGQVEQDASFIARSPNRTKVVKRLTKGTAMPTQIRDSTGQEFSRITEAANSLRDRELIELVVEEDTKRGRLYTLTEKGEDAWEFMINNNMVDDDGVA